MKSIIINNKKISINGIIFDKDGTLIEIYPILWSLLQVRIKKLARLVSKKIIAPYLKSVGVSSSTKKINPYGPLACAPKNEEIIICASLLFNHGYKYPEARKIAQTAYDEADRDMNVKNGLKMISGVKKLFECLYKNKIKIFIATSDSVGRTQKMLKILGILKYVTYIVGADIVEKSKPHPEAVEHIIKKHKIKPDKLAVVGDSILDMQMGIAAGIKYNIGVLTGTSTKKELKKYTNLIIKSVGEVKTT